MRHFCLILLLWGAASFSPAQARPSEPPYQFMHVRYAGSRIYFSPAYKGQEYIKVTDYQQERYTLLDMKQLGWEAMSRLLTEFSEQGWELVNVLPENSKDGNEGAIYLLRRPK